jgi:predicted lipoprotein with Yx(FWY)xxD motif
MSALAALLVTITAAVAPLANAPAGERAHAAGKATSRPALSVSTSSRYGRYLVDRRGLTLYLFTKEATRRSECYGACAAAWPPYLVKPGERLTVGRGLRRSRIGTTRRSDGSRQVTYAGHPLYHYVSERHAGEIFCQNVNEYGGDWLIVNPNGRPNRTPH